MNQSTNVLVALGLMVGLAMLLCAATGFGFWLGRIESRPSTGSGCAENLRPGRARVVIPGKSEPDELPLIEPNDVYPYDAEYAEETPEERTAREELTRDVQRIEADFFQKLGL